VSRLARAILAAAALLLAGPVFAGPAGQPALGHAELISSLPGAGQALPEAPAEVVLAFTERLDPLGTSVDILDADGRVIVRAGGGPDPADARRLVVPVPDGLGEGLYTVAWRSLSADDGHSSQGFFNFGIGDAAVPGARPHTGDVHGGHGAGQALAETISRLLGQAGSLLAFGLLVAALAFGRMVGADVPRRILGWVGIALLVAAAGAAMLVPLASSWAAVSISDYALATAPGNLMVGRAVVGGLAGLAVLLLSDRAPRLAWVVAGVAAVALIVLQAAAGHASAFASPAPVAMMAAHIGAAGSWLAGLLVLRWIVVADEGARRGMLAVALPRFSAMALVAVGLFALTGVYTTWLMNGQLADLGSPYGVLLAAKVVLAFLALSIGALNYLGWRADGRIGIARRLAPEVGIALAVVGVTALLASGTPPGPLRPIPIAEAITTAPTRLESSLGLLPGRPGPNRAFATLGAGAPAPSNAGLELVLNRLDQAGQTRIAMQPLEDDATGKTWTTDFLAPTDSRWDASLRLLVNGAEQSRTRYVFGFGQDRLSEGRAVPLIHPLTVVALIFAGLAVLAATLALAGGYPPRTHGPTARRALLAGAAVAGSLAAVALILPPPV